jgi:hypothetical protein
LEDHDVAAFEVEKLRKARAPDPILRKRSVLFSFEGRASLAIKMGGESIANVVELGGAVTPSGWHSASGLALDGIGRVKAGQIVKAGRSIG